MNAKSMEEKGLGLMLHQEDVNSLIVLIDKVLEDRKMNEAVRKYKKISERFDGVEGTVEYIKNF